MAPDSIEIIEEAAKEKEAKIKSKASEQREIRRENMADKKEDKGE